MALLIDTPEILDVEDQHAFNLALWERLLEDEELGGLPYRVETDRLGQLIMSPPPHPDHGGIQMYIGHLLRTLLSGGSAISECPLSTSEGVKAVDAVWISKARRRGQRRLVCFTKAPEICIEILSPDNSKRQMKEKKRLYFEAGAEEVWFRERNGRMQFFLISAPDEPVAKSVKCPKFPLIVVEEY